MAVNPGDLRKPVLPIRSDASFNPEDATQAFIPNGADAAPQTVTHFPSALPRTTGRYRILGELGRGGMGEVYLAEDPTLGRRVALKRLPSAVARDPERLEQFRQEARLLAAVNHPNIATIFSLEEADGVSFLTMEAIEGETLRDRIGRGTMSLRESLDVGRQIARALEAAHKREIIHRDLKPGNVMVSADLGIKVLDFGLAVSADPSPSGSLAGERTGSSGTGVAGTPGYMSPEQLRGEIVDARSDIWAFGCLLFECLSGARAIEGTSTQDLIRHTLTSDPDLDRLPSTTPDVLRALLRRCLARDPQDRYESITEPRRAIEELLAVSSIFSVGADQLKGESSVPNNLPKHASSFVGRSRQLEEIAILLNDHRLVTLTGIGGVGKTRLALRAAEMRLESGYQGIWFIDLAPQSSSAEIAASIVQAIRIPETLDRSPLESIVDFFSERQILLVFDNCEHMLEEAAAFVGELLRRTRGAHLLLTSRERLGIEGERSYSVPVLDLPAGGEAVDPGTIERSGAVELFVQRARHTGVDLKIDASNAATIAEICRRLDGIPLAIELAASRLRAIPAAELLRRLDDRFRVLTGGARTGLPRHRTLRALIDWSYEQLDAHEQALLNRLAVFAGGWTLEAAEEVTSGGTVEDWEVLDLLSRLVDKSLIETDHGAGSGTIRFRMLETVRAYGLEKLAAAGETTAIRARHRDYFISLASRAEMEMGGANQAAWIVRLAGEYENLRRTYESCAEPGADPALGLRIAAALFRFWMVRGHWNEAHTVCRDALARAEGLAPTPDLAKVLNAAAGTVIYNGRLVEAQAYWERALDVWTRLGNQSGIGVVRMNLGNVFYLAGDYANARICFAESLDICRATGNDDGIGRSLISLSNTALVEGDYEEARARAIEAVEHLTRLGHPELTAHALVALGTAELRLENLDEAQRRYEQSLEIQRELGDQRNIAIATINLAVVHHRQRLLPEATARFREAITILHRLGDLPNMASALDGLAGLAADQAAYGNAAIAYGAADAIRERLGTPRMPDEQKITDDKRESLRMLLGEADLERLTSEGRGMGVDVALGWALESF